MKVSIREKIFPIKVIFVETFSILLIIGSFFSSNLLMLFSAALLSAYIISEHDDTLCIALLFCILPFSQIFNNGNSSYFVFLKLAFIIKYFYRKTLINKRFFYWLLIFVVYSIFNMTINGTVFSGYMRLVNLVFWVLTIYIMSCFSTSKTCFYVGRHFLFGLILSCCIALFSDSIPGLNAMLSAATINQSVSRFSGLWNDPNTYSVFMSVGLTIVFLFYAKKEISAMAFYVLAGILSVFALLSLSKMCLILVLFVWIGMLMINKKIEISQKILIVAAFGLLCICVWYFFPDIISTYIWRFNMDSSNSYSLDSLTTHRFELWKIYISELNDDPISWIIGNGMGCSLPIGRAAHQSVLQIIYNSGIVGLLLLIEMVYVSCQPLFSDCNSSSIVDTKMKLISLFPLFIILIGAMFIDYYFIEYIYFLFFLAVTIRKGVCYRYECVEL